jgi:hypothetical protein
VGYTAKHAAFFSFCVFSSRPLHLYAGFLLYFAPVSPDEQSRKKKAKEAAASKPAAARGDDSCGGGDGGSGV